MPQCPHCKNPYDKGQRYCSVCGSFLLHPEEGDKFCPQCDVRVSPKQEFCHECDTPLTGPAAQGAAGDKAPEPPPAPGAYPLAAPAKGMQPWIIGGLVGAGVIIVILLILLFSRTSPPPAPTPAVSPKTEAAPAPAPPAPAPPTPAPAAPAPAAPKEEAPTPAAPATPPAAPPETKAPPATTPPAGLREELLPVLSAMREGHLKKDIVLYMSAYSLTFPGLDEKRRTTLRSWNNYDYINLVFSLDEIQPIDADNVVVKATWYIDTKDRSNQELASVKQTYEVRFVKELGKWRIRSLGEVD